MTKVYDVRIAVSPTAEPVTLDEMKSHLRIDHDDEDAALRNLITTARTYCEYVARRAFVTRTYRADLDKWPDDGCLFLPYPPLLAVTSITYTSDAAVTATLTSTVYGVDTQSEPGVVYLDEDQSWPSTSLRWYKPITITYTAGYGVPSAVPTHYKHAILLYAAHLYESREAVAVGQGITVTPLPLALDALLLVDRGTW